MHSQVKTKTLLVILLLATIVVSNIFVFRMYFGQGAGELGFTILGKHIGPSRVTLTNTPKLPPIILKSKSGEVANRDRLLTLMDPSDVASLGVLFSSIDADDKLSLDCHDIGHDLGHYAYRYYGWTAAMKDQGKNTRVEDVCAGGFMHGVFEQMFYDHPEMVTTMLSNTKAPEFCGAYTGDRRQSCFHGLGHSLMFLNARSTTTSLATCGKFSDIDAPHCAEGVWMEFFWGETEHAGTTELGWNLDDPLAPCKATEKFSKPGCYLYSVFGWLRSHPKNYAGAARFCKESGLNESDLEYCVKGVGTIVASGYNIQQLERMEKIGAELPEEWRPTLYEQVFSYAKFSGFSRKEASSTCASFAREGSLCSDAVGVIYGE